MSIVEALKELALRSMKKETQTTFNTDGLDELLEDGEAENVYSEDNQTEQ